MRRHLLGLMCLTLAACSPVYVTAPAGGDVLPVEAQRVIDHATATAAAVATQNAQATATGQSDRETATAASQGTLGALAARQTEAGVSMTLDAARAEFTATAAQNVLNFRASQAWSTPTAAAMRAQATAQAADSARQQAQAASTAEFWQTIRFIFLALLIVAGLTAIAVIAFDRVTAVRIAQLQARADVAVATFGMIDAHHWREWTPADGHRVYQIDEPEPAGQVIENAPVTHDLQWRTSLLTLVLWADQAGAWTFDALGPNGAAVVDRGDWERATDYLRDVGLLLKRDRSRTRWATDTTPAAARALIRQGLPLPYPDAPPPQVHVPRAEVAQISKVAQPAQTAEKG